MLIDVRNNELIVSEIVDKGMFNSVRMRDIPKIVPREYKGKYYFSMADFHMVRSALSKHFRSELRLTQRYLQMADHFVRCNHEEVHIEHSPHMSTISGTLIPFKSLIPATSYFNKQAIHAKQYGKSWSGYTHLFDVIKGTFPSGLIEIVLDILKKDGVPFTIHRTFDYPEPYLNLNPVFPFEPTEDQFKAVDALDAANTGIGKLPTGFGKTSYVAGALIAKKGVRSMFLANQNILVDDAKKDFETVFKENDDITIGLIADGKYKPGDITVASIQSIASALRPPTKKEFENADRALALAETRFTYAPDEEAKVITKKEVASAKRKLKNVEKRIQKYHDIIQYLKTVDLFIVDESQVLGTDQWNLFLEHCHAPYRYTLSATDTRNDGGRLELIAATGGRRFESNASDQIEKGRLSEFLGHFKKFDHKMEKELVKEINMSYHHAYEVFIVRNDLRNRHLCEQVLKWANDYSVLALVTRREHGEIVLQLLADMGLKEGDARYVDGETPKEERRESIEAFRNGDFKVLIGTSIFDVGFNAKNAAKMVRFNAGGSEVREPQRAGRTVRLREDGSIGETYDVLDINCPFFESQGWKRYRFLRDEFGKARAKVLPGTVEGEMDIVGLSEIVTQIEDKTDREKGEEIIRRLETLDDDSDEPEIEYEYDYEGSLAKKLDEIIKEDGTI